MVTVLDAFYISWLLYCLVLCRFHTCFLSTFLACFPGPILLYFHIFFKLLCFVPAFHIAYLLHCTLAFSNAASHIACLLPSCIAFQLDCLVFCLLYCLNYILLVSFNIAVCYIALMLACYVLIVRFLYCFILLHFSHAFYVV